MTRPLAGQLRNCGLIPGKRKRFFSFSQHPDWFCGPLSLKTLFPKVKQRPGHEAGHSLLSNNEIKNEWSYTSTPIYAFMACTGTTLTCLLLKSVICFDLQNIQLGRHDSLTVYPFHTLKCLKNKFYKKRYLFLWVLVKNGRIMVPSVLLVIR